VNRSKRRFVAAAAAFAAAACVETPALARHRGQARHAARRSAARAAHAAKPEPAAAAPAQAEAPPADTTARLDVQTFRKVDPQGLIRKPLLAQALVALERHRDHIADPNRIFIADFARHSSAARLYMVDMASGEVTAFRTAHGRGSDPDRSGWARKFSNTPSSYASSLGAYVTTGQSFGLKHGTHIGLDGLDATNSEARDRAIVVHSADYCELPFLRSFGMLGRSEGCFATSSREFKALLPQLGQGRLLYAGT
jgi:hypothetical protein